MPTITSLMTEHAAWRTTEHGRHRVFVLADGGQWLVTAREHEMLSRPLIAGTQRPRADGFVLPDGTATDIPELEEALRTLGLVARFRTLDMWDAIGTAIIRQVIRATHAKRLYLAFCEAYGQCVTFMNGDGYALFPAAEVVLGLRDEQFAAVGLTFKRRPLCAAAEAYLKHGVQWRELAPAALVRELQQVPRIGAWTAGAAVADFSNDFTLYPFADLAVRTWAKRAAPSYPWPDNEKTFAGVWQAPNLEP